jgi:outer membrane protein assembly factor BamB
VYFQGKVYYAASYDQVKAFPLQNGQFNTGAIVTSSKSFNVLGAGLSLSAAPDGTGAILWALECVNSTGALHAYDPATLNELYNTSMAANGIDAPGASVKFAIPTVVNGKVYVGTQNSLTVYGLHYLPPRHRRVRPAE